MARGRGVALRSRWSPANQPCGVSVMGRGPGVRVVGEEAIQLDFRWKGQRCRERVRLAPTKANLAYCRGWKRRIEDEIAHGTFDYGKHFPESHRARNVALGVSLSDVLSGYCDSLSGTVEPETAREYRHDAARFAREVGDPPFRAVTRALIREWVAKKTLSKSRIDSILAPVRGAFRQAVEDGLSTTNPLEGFKVRRVVGPRAEVIDPFTPEEIARLDKTEYGDLWTFWAWTGLRSGEVIGLEWGDVDSRRASVSIRRAVRLGRTKAPKTTSGTRVVHLLEPARRSLNVLKQGPKNGSVFRNPVTGKGWHEAKALNRAFARACEKAEVRRRYVYQLRHTFATWALSSGENPAWIAKQMGHSDTSMLYRHYGKWMPQMAPKAGSRMLAKAGRGQRAA